MSINHSTTPKLKPNFGSARGDEGNELPNKRHKRLSDTSTSVAYKSPLLDQSPSPASTITSPLPVQSKRPRHRLSWSNKSFQSPVLGASSSQNLNSPVETSSFCGESKVNTIADKGSSCKSVCKLAKDPISPKGTFSLQSRKISQQEDRATFSTEALRDSVKGLWVELQSIEKQIIDLKEQGYLVEELEWYVDKLHEYNEIKDVAQMVMGRIAVLERTTVKEIHEDYGLTEND